MADAFGTVPGICLKPDFLGGSLTASSLCGQGAAEPIAHPLTGQAIATVMLFRNTSGFIHVTVSTECGWLLVPSDSAAGSVLLEGVVEYAPAAGVQLAAEDLGQATKPASNRRLAQSGVSEASTSSAEGTGSGAAAQQEGAAAAPASSSSAFSAPSGAQSQAVQRYSCLSSSVALADAPSACGALAVTVRLRFALSAFALAGDGACALVPQRRNGDSAVLFDATFSLGSTQAKRVVWSPPPAPPTLKSKPELAQLAAITAGYKVLSTYTTTIDPVSDSGSAWLADMRSQAPLVALSFQEHRLSFLLGAVVTGMYGGGGVVNGLSCSMTSMGLARTALGAWMYISDDIFRDITCLQSPFASVASDEVGR